MVLLDTGTPGTSREIFSQDADDGTRTRNPLHYKPSALAIELYSSKVVSNRGVANSSPIIGILNENFSTGTRSSCVQWNQGTSRMRSQSQLRNNKIITMQYTN